MKPPLYIVMISTDPSLLPKWKMPNPKAPRSRMKPLYTLTPATPLGIYPTETSAKKAARQYIDARFGSYLLEEGPSFNPGITCSIFKVESHINSDKALTLVRPLHVYSKDAYTDGDKHARGDRPGFWHSRGPRDTLNSNRTVRKF